MADTRMTMIVFLMSLIVFGPTIAYAQTMKPHHKNAGLECSDCHITKPFEEVLMDQCQSCHDIPEKKEDYHGAPDKHDSPHYGPELECDNCHAEHEESDNFCNSCHEFDFKVP
ncbi:cytochrome c3 family protein [Shewanella youngdeokensis]|uniref:Cytochrome c3 family protein n=1 Tax=Shewanella youngdeokensis TaxID=2999068 RepID=A0ABZ0JXY8_9GAMM|nr:cytochrome c3 family protein [Shewanella sp. DAU334]